MKRFWHTWLAMVAVAATVSTASAQSGSRYTPEIGSYQSILTRAGYGEATPSASDVHSMPMYGQPVQGCGTPGGCNGGTTMMQPTYGVPMQQPGQAYQGAPVPTAPVHGMQAAPMAPASSDPVVSSYDGPCAGAGVSGGYANYGAPAYAAPMYSASSYGNSYANACGGSAVYSPGASIGGVGAVAGRAERNRNLVASVGALVFVRDYEDTRLIARNPAGDYLFTNDADHDTMGGVDFGLASRGQNGNGWEFRYFELFPDTADQTLTGANVESVGLRGFDRLDYNGAGLDTYYNAGTTQTVSRETDIRNLEFNLLRNGGRYCTRHGRKGNFELLGGFRYFQFDEQFTYSTADGTNPLDYILNADNTLLGLQLGTRSEICLSNKLRLAGMVKAGLFNNRIETRQRILNQATGVYATVPSAAGRDYDYSDTKNDVAMLSEIDLGLIYQVSCNARLRVGYRAIGVAGVALATDQIPYEFNNTLSNSSANSNGNLLLHGGYIGTEFCF